MRFSHFFIARPIFASVISLVILIVGSIAYLTLPVAQFPEIVPPTISVNASYPGANAVTVADTVASVIEQEVNGVEDMIYMYSQSTDDGNMQLSVTFDIGTDIDKAQVLVQNRVSAAEPRLPEEVRRNGITVNKRTPDLLLVVHLVSPNGTYDQVYTSNYALLNVRDELARIPGVGEVSLFGAREYSMRIWLDPERIALRGMTADEVLAALRAQNLQVAGGALGQPPQPDMGAFQLSLQLKGRLLQPSEFENIVLKTGQDGRVVRVKDVGRVELGALNYTTYGYQDAYPATVLIVTQQPGSNAIDTANAIKAEMQRISQRFPKDLEYRIIYNPTDFIEYSIAELYITILEAVALVVIVVLLFLQTWRATIIPLVTIPVSLIGTFAVMQALGFSINMLTLFGLVLAVGIVVDDAIVVVENVERKLRDGLRPVEAARVTMDEVGTALIAIALVLTAVFVPTAFIGGITGQFYRQFAVTVATATIISAFNSLTLSPALCATLLKPHDAHRNESLLMRPVHTGFRLFNRGFDKLALGYGALVQRVIAVAPLMLAAYALLLGAAGWLLMHTPAGFIPKMDRGLLIVSLQLPQGASLARTDEVVRRANAMIMEVPGVAHTSAYTGRSGSTFSNAANAGAIFVVVDEPAKRLPKGLTVEKISELVTARLNGIEESKTAVFIPPPVRGMGGQTGFSMRLQNRANLSPREFEKIANDFIAAANETPGIKNVFTTFSTGTPQLYVDVDRDKAQMLKVPLESIFEALRVYLGSAYVNDFNMFGRTYRVTAQADSAFRVQPDNVARIRVRNEMGQMVPLGNLVTFRNIAGPDRMPRYNLFPTIEVNGAMEPGISTGQALQLIADLAKRELPDGVTYEWTDLSYQEAKAGSTGYYIFALSVVFVFLALAAQFESWSLPLAIILIVPMCLLSALFGVSLHGQDINILTQIGFIVLIGLAAKNAILIVEFARQLEDRGRDTVSAAVEAAKLRLRPILMTSLAFTLGVVPLYIATGAGAEMRIALGTGVFWGMIGVTLFGLVFTPVFYVVIRRLSTRRRGTTGVTAPAE
ncbi:MAG: multidrug efflux RND transporter permease subunit [Hyphomicrobium sp.]|uniref:efflux RND transporter permease subunit n=1 Tax=Hyphomicrobium sp. TaxID=82 RepID=UPI0013267D57|nr:multidrug efflux RND transporter permease subunit [Hyphomicrobium sp.]KAB2942619.1 MAG: multidrug efflux RND transporter permease subunit [Hyphomicrobium sp.]MBZ0208603.1 multidrug efflux RND transporter permease subunit [Hyphomicrobium sp.]